MSKACIVDLKGSCAELYHSVAQCKVPLCICWNLHQKQEVETVRGLFSILLKGNILILKWGRGKKRAFTSKLTLLFRSFSFRYWLFTDLSLLTIINIISIMGFAYLLFGWRHLGTRHSGEQHAIEGNQCYWYKHESGGVDILCNTTDVLVEEGEVRASPWQLVLSLERHFVWLVVVGQTTDMWQRSADPHTGHHPQ